MQNFSCENLSFYYGKKVILDKVSFNIKRGDVIALVGLNGCGKTTFLKILAGINKSPLRKDYSVSALIEKPCFYPYLTGLQNLQYFKITNKTNLCDINTAIKMVGLKDSQYNKYQSYSLGMKCRLGIAKCLIEDTDLYIFDEPLNGLDINGIIMFRNIVHFLKQIGKTVVISSHILSELDKYCNKLFIIDKTHLYTYDLPTKNNGIIEDIFMSRGIYD